MTDMDNEFFGETTGKKETTSIKDTLKKYLAYWPIFILSMALFVAGAILYLRKATPKYIANALILVKGDKNTSNRQDLISTALVANQTSNMENELQLMRSSGLTERIVLENQFNISYYLLGRVKTTDVYLDAPFRLVLQTSTDSTRGLTFTIKNLSNTGANIKYGPKANINESSIKWNTPYTIEGHQFVLVPKGKNIANAGEFMVAWNPVKQTAQEIASKFSVDWLDKKTTILQLSILIENLDRGKDILNALVKEYDRSDLEEKSIASRNTIRFIDDRLDIISRELSGVEGSLENYQGRNQIVDVVSQSGQAFSNSNTVSKDILDINIQKGVVDQIQGYFNNPENPGKLVPSSLGIDDPTLGTLISKYNELELKKQREKPLLSSKSEVLKDLDNQINDVKGSVIENLQNISKNLNLQQNSLQQKNNQYQQFLTSLPRKERVMQEIKRKQTITEGLYLYLLQKREESSIAAGATNISVYKQIDRANGYGPVEPNSRNIMIVSILLGLLMPVGLILLIDQFNDKVINRSDVTSRLATPILGELVHIPNKKVAGIMVMNRNLFGEQFRLIRTNLAIAGNDKKTQVILVTSSTINEGKSLISLNLAAVLAAPGKKVALLEFDMRKPGIAKKVGLDNTKGLSDYLAGHTIDLSALYHVSNDIPSLHIYPAGPIPSNAADLLLNENVAPLFEVLRRRYDYVIIDTAPVGLVSDAFILNDYADASVYVIRQRHTLKKQLDYINDIYVNRRLNNVGIVLNDVKTGGKYGSSYGYGENYNYTYGEETKKKWWKKSPSTVGAS